MKPTKETASRDHSLEDSEILERYIAASQRLARDEGGSFDLPDRTLSWVDGAELELCNALGAYRVPFIEKDGDVTFGDVLRATVEAPTPPKRHPMADAHQQKQESDRFNREGLAKERARWAEERRRKREKWEAKLRGDSPKSEPEVKS